MSSELAERLRAKYFGGAEHPYTTFEKAVEAYLKPTDTLLDGGCGYTAPVLRKYLGKASRLIGIDMVEFPEPIPGIELYNGDMGHTGLEDGTVDLVMCRSVMEHVDDPETVYREMYRVLKPGGRFVFLTANLWDYASLIAKLVPNSLHPWVVSKTEGRAEKDVFPIRYRTNTRGAVEHWCRVSGFEVEGFQHLGQYPCYFMFNGFLFWLATGYEKLISRFDSLAFLRGWIFVTLRKPA